MERDLLGGNRHSGFLPGYIATASRTVFGRVVIVFSLVFMGVFAANYYILNESSFGAIEQADMERSEKNAAILVLSDTVRDLKGLMLPLHDAVLYSTAYASHYIDDAMATAILEKEVQEAAAVRAGLGKLAARCGDKGRLCGGNAGFMNAIARDTAELAPAIDEVFSSIARANALARMKGGEKERAALIRRALDNLDRLHVKVNAITVKIDTRIGALREEFGRAEENDYLAQESIHITARVGFALLEGAIAFLCFVQLVAIGRVRADEVRLRDEKEKYRKLMASAGDAIVITDAATGIIMDVNREAEALFGEGRESLLGRSQADLFPPDRRESYAASFNRASRQGEVLRNLEVRRTDGSTVPVEVRTSLTVFGNRSIAQGIYRDMTHYVESENKLAGQANFLKRLLDAIPNPVFFKDAQGTYMGCNHAFADWFGMGVEDVIGKSVYDLSPPQLAAVYEQKDNELLGSPDKAQVYESLMQTKNAGLRNVMFYASCYFDAAGAVAGVVGVGLDITERKQLEKEQENLVRQTVEALQEAREANRLKTEFLANMSHELRTPLTSILGYSRLAGDKCHELVDGVKEVAAQAQGAARDTGVKAVDDLHAALEFNTTIIHEAEKLYMLITDILDLSQLDAGQLKFMEGVVSADMVLHAVVESQAAAAREKNIKVVTNREQLEAADILFVGDQMRIEQVLKSIVNNAIKFSDHGEVQVSTGVEGGRVRFTVRDQGIGIPEKELHSIFESFRQLDGSSTRSHEGVGLGLTLAKRLAGAMGGAIDVRSEVDRGSVFTVSFPYRPVGGLA